MSTWGHDKTCFQVRRPLDSAARLLNVSHFRQNRFPLTSNAIIYETPVVHWTPRLFSGRFRTILKANRANLERARHELGPFDLIHAQEPFPAALIAQVLAKDLDIPYIVTTHSGSALRAEISRTRLGHAAFTEALRHAAATIAVSESLARNLTEIGTAPTDIIPNVVDEEFFTPAKRSTQGEPHRVFALAALETGKGISVLLEAVSQLRVTGTSLVVRIGGDGALRDGLQRRAQSLGVSEQVTFLGRLTREAVRRELRACSCLVLPSDSETFGVVCIEALACGRPVVATLSGGPEDIVTDINGVLVPTQDSVALAVGLKTVLGREYDSGAIRRDAISRFGTEAVTSAIEAVYRRVTAGGSRSNESRRQEARR